MSRICRRAIPPSHGSLSIARHVSSLPLDRRRFWGRNSLPSTDFPPGFDLPDEPLMLVDRVIAIEGIARSMLGGRIVTEHVVRPESWYLDAGRIVPGIAIEAGQADLLALWISGHRL